MSEITGKTYGLPSAPGHQPARLHVVTPGPDLTVTAEAVCTGSMVCSCRACEEDRRRRADRAKTPPAAQPWEPRIRRLAA